MVGTIYVVLAYQRLTWDTLYLQHAAVDLVLLLVFLTATGASAPSLLLLKSMDGCLNDALACLSIREHCWLDFHGVSV